MKHLILLGISLLFVGSGCVSAPTVSTPDEPDANDPVVVEDFGNAAEKADLIVLETPMPNQAVRSPLLVKGRARGNWFFEASFPVTIVDWDGRIIGEGIAQAQGEWMTTDFVPFEATLTFTADPQAYSDRGSLILQKDNPSGLPERDDALEIPVVIEGSSRI